MQNTNRGKWIFRAALLVLMSIIASCKNYLDVVPDNIPTIENAFTMRKEAEKYLYTCYSYMPRDADPSSNPALLAGDEIWAFESSVLPEFDHRMFNIARGQQGTINPVGDFHWNNLYRGLRDCNIFLENVENVPDLIPQEKMEWIAEVKFLKAYYHFYLMRMYGPIPLIKDNLPVDADIEAVRVPRNTVDECFEYVKQLLDEAKDNLPLSITNPARQLGRITKPIAYSLKAKVMVTAASPLFNGNTDMAALRNRDGKQLFNQTASVVKWDSAVVATKKAIDMCLTAGNAIYKFNPSVSMFPLKPFTKTQMDLRNAFTERWNNEIVWGNTQGSTGLLQRVSAAKVDHRYLDNPRVIGEFSPTLKIAEMFYTKNGVPLTEDKTRVNTGPTRIAGEADQLQIRKDYVSAALNFDREPRFYSNLGFDGGIWYGQGSYDDSKPLELYYIAGRKGQPNAKNATDGYSVTGYYVKKYVHYQNVQGSGVSDYTINDYAWPLIRLSHLFLLYAEALNEVSGPTDEVHNYIDQIRERAGLQTVKTSWDTYSNLPSKYTTKDGMREIIQQEQLIELAFEGQRFWDLRRWKKAIQEYNRKPIQGWDLQQSDPAFYYRTKVIYEQKFGLKDYFWPIRDNNLLVNKNLVQNIGW